MTLRLPRRKAPQPLVALVYRTYAFLRRLLPARLCLAWLLDIEWIVGRLVLEESFRQILPSEHPHRTSALRFILRRLRQTDHVVDLGANAGDLSALLAAHCSEVVAVEKEESLVTQASRTHTAANLRFVHADVVGYLEQPNSSCDVIVLSHILEHLDSPSRILELVGSRCERVYIEVPDLDATYSNQHRLRLGRSLVYTDGDHVSEFDREGLAALLEEAGLAILEQECRFGVIRVWCSRTQQAASQDARA